MLWNVRLTPSVLSALLSAARAPLGYNPYVLWQNVGSFHHTFECPGNSVILKYLEPITFRLLQDQEMVCWKAFSASGFQALPASQTGECICCASSGRGLLAHLHLHRVAVYHSSSCWESSAITHLGTALMQCEWWLSSSAGLLMALILPLQWCAEMALSSDWLFIFSLGKLWNK